jgi:hypothetical protein
MSRHFWHKLKVAEFFFLNWPNFWWNRPESSERIWQQWSLVHLIAIYSHYSTRLFLMQYRISVWFILMQLIRYSFSWPLICVFSSYQCQFSTVSCSTWEWTLWQGCRYTLFPDVQYRLSQLIIQIFGPCFN